MRRVGNRVSEHRYSHRFSVKAKMSSMGRIRLIDMLNHIILSALPIPTGGSKCIARRLTGGNFGEALKPRIARMGGESLASI